jgi:hypothetical protein
MLLLEQRHGSTSWRRWAPTCSKSGHLTAPRCPMTLTRSPPTFRAWPTCWRQGDFGWHTRIGAGPRARQDERMSGLLSKERIDQISVSALTPSKLREASGETQQRIREGSKRRESLRKTC